MAFYLNNSHTSCQQSNSMSSRIDLLGKFLPIWNLLASWRFGFEFISLSKGNLKTHPLFRHRSPTCLSGPFWNLCYCGTFPWACEYKLESGTVLTGKEVAAQRTQRPHSQWGPRRAMSTDWTDFTLTHWAKGDQGNEQKHCCSFWLLGNTQPQLMKCFWKGLCLEMEW